MTDRSEEKNYNLKHAIHVGVERYRKLRGEHIKHLCSLLLFNCYKRWVSFESAAYPQIAQIVSKSFKIVLKAEMFQTLRKVFHTEEMFYLFISGYQMKNSIAGIEIFL